MPATPDSKNLLVVTYNFPPVGRSHVMRVLKFVKYLPDYGWRSIVLTTRGYPAGADARDDSLLRDIPPTTRVYRTISIDPTSVMYYLSSVMPWKKGERSSTPSSKSNSIYLRLYSFVRSVVLIPEESIFWAPFALAESLLIFQRENIRAIFTTGPPYSNMLIAYLLKKIYRKPLIIDYRDRWFNNPLSIPRYQWRLRLERWLEEKVLHASDTVVCISQEMVDEYRRSFPSLSPGKFRVIHNGYDSGDLQITSEASGPGALGITPKRLPKKFVLTYTGGLLPPKTPVYFLEALRQLIRENPGLKDRLQVYFVGPSSSCTREMIGDLPVEAVGMVPHGRVQSYLAESDVLLLFLFKAEDGGIGYPTKFFEYLTTGKPMLAMVPEGATAKIVAENSLGIVVPPDDVDLIKGAIRKLYREHIPGKPAQVNGRLLEQFDRRALTRLLASALDENCQSAGSN